MRAKRDYAMLAMLFGCGFRRSELVGLEFEDIQKRQGHWAVVDLVGKGGHIRTVPIPNWAKAALDQWLRAANVTEGKIFRAVARMGKVWAAHLAERCLVRGENLLRESRVRTHCPARPAADLCKVCHSSGGELEQIQFLARACLGADYRTLPWLQTESRTSGERSFRPQDGGADAGKASGICRRERRQRSCRKGSLSKE